MVPPIDHLDRQGKAGSTTRDELNFIIQTGKGYISLTWKPSYINNNIAGTQKNTYTSDKEQCHWPFKSPSFKTYLLHLLAR